MIWGRSSGLKFWVPQGPILMKTKKIPEKSKTQNFKNPKQYFYQDQWEEISEKIERIQKRFEGGVAFWSFGSHRVPC